MANPRLDDLLKDLETAPASRANKFLVPEKPKPKKQRASSIADLLGRSGMVYQQSADMYRRQMEAMRDQMGLYWR